MSLATDQGDAASAHGFRTGGEVCGPICGAGKAPGRFRRAVHKLRLKELHEREEEIAGVSVSLSCVLLYLVHDIDVEVVERSSLARACALESSPVLGVVWVWASRIQVYSQSTLSCPSSRPACRKRYHEEPIINARVAFGTFDFGLTSSLSSIYVDSDVHAVQVGRCAVWQRQVRDEGADECRMARQPRGTDVRVAGNSGQNQLHLQVPC